MLTHQFYVYRIFSDDKTLYVGKGSGPRLSKQKSKFGASGEIVAFYEDEEEAYAAEVALIAELSPPFNIHPGGNGPRGSLAKVLPHGFTPEGLVAAAPSLAKILRTWSRDNSLTGLLNIFGAYIKAHGEEAVQSAVLPHLRRFVFNDLALENKP